MTQAAIVVAAFRKVVMTVGNKVSEAIGEQGRANLAALEGLEPHARARFTGLVLLLAYQGYGRIRILEGRRSLERQQLLYGLGRSELQCKLAGVPAEYAKPAESEVTWCAPEVSGHVRGISCDIDLDAYGPRAQRDIVNRAKLLGFEWGGDWTVKDKRHFQAGG